MDRGRSMIRLAKESDIKDILRLLVQVDMVHHKIRPDLFKGPATKYTYDELEAIIKNNDMDIFVYADNDRVLGYIMCESIEHNNDNVLTNIKTLYIDDLCVDEEARHKHIASKLYDYVACYAKEKGYYNITLNVWNGNDSAYSFYEAMGMKIQKTTMEKIL